MTAERSINNSGATISGNGVIQLVNDPIAVTSLLVNDGTLSAGNLGPVILTPARTLQITGGSPNARVDLDGAIGLGIVNVNRNATFDINVAINDAVDGDINLADGATLDVATPWEISGTVDVNTPGIFVGTGGPAAHLAGGAITFSGGTLTLNDGLDSLALDAAFNSTAGVINNSGTIIVNSVSTIGAGTDFNMLGGESKLTVNGTLNVDTPDFNLDGTELAGNVTTINAGGILDLDLGAGADLSYGHTINLNGGELDVTSSAATTWSLNSFGTINAAGGATSTINSGGETFQVSGDTNVTANSTLNVNSTTEFLSPASVVVDAGSTLNLAVTSYSGGIYTGGGVLRKGNATIAMATTWNVATVDFDDGTTTLNDNLTINADRVEVDADGVDSTHTISNTAQLAVNISGGGGWTLDSTGTINYNGDATVNTYLTGSDVTLNGTLNHTGDGRTNARLDIGAAGTVNILTAAEPLRLNGGDAAGNPNKITGGTIAGAGVLAADVGRALHGFGTIDTSVDFPSANLKADNGILTMNGAITSVRTLGTADADGILHVTNVWNTNQAGSVFLEGGELRGAAVTNGGALGISGHGLISARVINNTRIDAEGGGLLVETVANNNDWDGAGAGQLNAISGDLEMRDNAAFLFGGTVEVSAGRTAIANGFELEFEPGSTLSLEGSKYRSTNATDIGGAVTVGAGISILQIGGTTILENGSATTLTGDLQLDNAATRINAGATFAGGGSLINLAGRALTLADGADVHVLLHNDGNLILGDSAGQTQGLDYEQSATGAWEVELGGTGLNQFDRMALSGLAAIDGTLNLSLIDGYVPTLLDPAMTILTAASVTGTFASIVQPVGMPAGLVFDALYNPTNVQLMVSNAPPILAGDYNENGVVDAADYAVWRDNLGAVAGTLPNDVDGGVIGQPQYDTWKSNFGMIGGSGSGSLSFSAVPEPSTAMMLIIVSLAMYSRHRMSGS